MSPPPQSRLSKIRAFFADRSRWKRWALEGLVVVAIFSGVAYWRAADLPAGPAPWLGGTLADGRATDLAAVLQAANGRPVLVSFWATWCPICKAEEGNINAVARDWPTLTVAMQSGERMAVAKHLHERELRFAALVDADGAMAREWRVRGVPTHFIVDSHGVIRYQSVGYATEWGLRARLWWIDAHPSRPPRQALHSLPAPAARSGASRNPASAPSRGGDWLARCARDAVTRSDHSSLLG